MCATREHKISSDAKPREPTIFLRSWKKTSYRVLLIIVRYAHRIEDMATEETGQANFEEDPAAAFLQRETEELGDIGNEIFGPSTTQSDVILHFFIKCFYSQWLPYLRYFIYSFLGHWSRFGGR